MEKNSELKCRFCYAFHLNPLANAEHNQKCEFRVSDVFLAYDGKIKFACTVSYCFDIFFEKKKIVPFKMFISTFFYPLFLFRCN